MKTLIMDTASKFLYFAFLEDEKIIYDVFLEGHNNHSDNLLKRIEMALEETNLKLKDFERIIVGIGPGSYTGLRVSVTVAKMLAWTLNIPLYITSSLSLLSSGNFISDGFYAITLRAKKDHVYGKLIEVKNGNIKPIIEDGFFNESDFLNLIKQYNYKLINEDNYKINPNILNLEKVENVHNLTPNYIQKEL